MAFHRTFEELFNQGNDAIVDELLAPDSINHEAPPGKNRGPESMRQLVMWLRTAFPDLHYMIEDVVAEGDISYWSGIEINGVEFYPREGSTLLALPTNDNLVCVA